MDDPYQTARESQERSARRRRRRSSKTCAAAGAPAHEGLAAGSPSQRRGRCAEWRASRFLQDQGLQILEANLSCRGGEIDLTAREADILVFIEVRQRRSARYGGAAASVNRRKQDRLIRAARYFLPRLSQRHFSGRTPACRFDVVAFEGERTHWIRDAFGA